MMASAAGDAVVLVAGTSTINSVSVHVYVLGTRVRNRTHTTTPTTAITTTAAATTTTTTLGTKTLPSAPVPATAATQTHSSTPAPTPSTPVTIPSAPIATPATAHTDGAVGSGGPVLVPPPAAVIGTAECFGGTAVRRHGDAPGPYMCIGRCTREPLDASYDTNPAPPTTAGQALHAQPSALQPGALVVLNGLSSSALNGCRGRVGSYLADIGRYAVVLEDGVRKGDTCSIRSAHLTLQQEPAATVDHHHTGHVQDDPASAAGAKSDTGVAATGDAGAASSSTNAPGARVPPTKPRPAVLELLFRKRPVFACDIDLNTAHHTYTFHVLPPAYAFTARILLAEDTHIICSGSPAAEVRRAALPTARVAAAVTVETLGAGSIGEARPSWQCCLWGTELYVSPSTATPLDNTGTTHILASKSHIISMASLPVFQKCANHRGWRYFCTPAPYVPGAACNIRP